MEKIKRVLGGKEEGSDNVDILEVANQATTLGWGTRVKAFIGCFILGMLCSLLGSCFLWLPRVGMVLFAVLYTVGNICSLASTMFLMGPVQQAKRMCAKERLVATAAMLVCLVLTLCAALWWKNNGLAVLFCILQFVSFAWYGLSYIPFAREACIKMFSLCL